MQIRTVDGGMLDADEQPEAVMRIMGEDGVVIICQRSTISVPMNSLNRVQALESRGDLGYTTFEFMDREIFMSSVQLQQHLVVSFFLKVPHISRPAS